MVDTGQILAGRVLPATIKLRNRECVAGGPRHPERGRVISLREAAMLQTLPRTYQLLAPGERPRFAVLGRLIGNAVPVWIGEPTVPPREGRRPWSCYWRLTTLRVNDALRANGWDGVAIRHRWNTVLGKLSAEIVGCDASGSPVTGSPPSSSLWMGSSGTWLA